MIFHIPLDSSPDPQISLRSNNTSTLKRGGSPPVGMNQAYTHRNMMNYKDNFLFSDDNSMIIHQNGNSAASTELFSRYPLDNQSPSPIQEQQSLKKKLIEKSNKAGSGSIQKNPFQTTVNNNNRNVIMSDSDSSIYNDDGQQLNTNRRSFNDPKYKKKHVKSTSQSDRNAKSRNVKQGESKTFVRQSRPNEDNNLVQEGIKVLFAKNKKANEYQNTNPFSLQKQPMKAKPSVAPAEQKQTSFIKKSKTRKSVSKKAKKGLQRAKTQIDEKEATNIFIPNAQKLSGLQKFSMEFVDEFSPVNDQPQLLERLNTNTLSSASQSKTIKQGRGLQIIASFFKHQSKDQKRRHFERWKFMSLAQRSSVQILAQTRWINEIQSVRSESEYELQQKNRELILRKGIACLFRYRSRKLSNYFVQWKYRMMFTKYMQSFLDYKRNGNNYFPNNSENAEFVQDHLFQKYKTQKERISNISGTPGGQSEDLENISDDEESEERSLSKQKKMGLMQNKTVGRSSNKDYNFANPSAQLDQLPYQIELFRQILQSPNKDFGRLMRLQSESSIQYFNDNFVNDGTSSRKHSLAYNQNQNQRDVNGQSFSKSFQNQQLLQSILVVKKKCEGQLREVFREWKSRSDMILREEEREREMEENSQQQRLIRVISQIQLVNEKALIRHTQGAFNQWKFNVLIDKKAENKKLQQYFLNNAKLEIQKSKAVLHKLYQQKQMFDEEQQVYQRSRSPSPHDLLAAQYRSQYGYQSTTNPHNLSSFQSPPQREPYQQRFLNQPSSSGTTQPAVSPQQTQQIMQLMNPYFARNQHALPQKLQQMVNEKSNQIEVVNQIKGLCYDMLLEILDEAEKNNKQPTSN